MFQLTIAENYEALSKKAANFLANYIQKNPHAVLCCATGNTPTGMYEELARIVKDTQLDCSQLTIVKFDEWVGLDSTNPSTCEYYLQEHVIKPLSIPAEHYISFDANTTNPQKECERINTLLSPLTIDIFILGLGINGHLGFNEPGSDPTLHAHVVELTHDTLSHSMLSGNEKPVTNGMTLGIQDILHAKIALLLVNGVSKQQQFKKLMTKEVVSDFSASYLWNHPQFICFADKEVASE